MKKIWFQLKAIFNYFFGINEMYYTPPGYKKVFTDTFSDAKLNKEKWGYAEPWGFVHPKHTYVYYDKKGNKATNVLNSSLQLKTTYRPAFINVNNDKIKINWCAGKIYSKQSFQHGWFEAMIKLPTGVGLWPAFWLTGTNSWPPEIDILEAYSKHGSPFIYKFLGLKLKNWRIKPNAHWGFKKHGTKEDYGAYNVPVKNANKRFVKYALHWERDFIRIYYDGVKVFEITDPHVLKYFNRPNADMRIILNNNIDKGNSHDESAMLVDNISVYQETD